LAKLDQIINRTAASRSRYFFQACTNPACFAEHSPYIIVSAMYDSPKSSHLFPAMLGMAGQGAARLAGSVGRINTGLDCAQPAGLATAGVLTRHKPKPRGKLPAIFEAARIPYYGDHCRGSQWPNARNLPEPLTRFVASMPSLNLGRDLIDLLIKHLQMLEQLINEGRNIGASIPLFMMKSRTDEYEFTYLATSSKLQQQPHAYEQTQKLRPNHNPASRQGFHPESQ
jgi:hypothetical protein